MRPLGPGRFWSDSRRDPATQGQAMRDVLLVALTVASGAVDAISYFGLGKIFSAFMTGNIVYLGFGIAQIEGPDVIPVISALSMFAAGSYLGLRITTLRSKESGLWPPAMTVLLTLVAIAESASLAVWLATTGHPPTAVCDVLIALFSLAMGIQTAAVRSLGVQGVFTTAGTFTLVAFDRYFRRISVEGRDPSPHRRIRRVGRGRRWRRTALATRAQLCTAAAAGDHCSGDRVGAAHGASHVGRR